MATAYLYFPSKVDAVELTIESFSDGIELLQGFVDDLLSERAAGFALSLIDWYDDYFPTLHFQQCSGGCILQVYLPENAAVDGEEGWHTLVESDEVRSANVEDLVKESCDAEVGEQYQRVRFTEGEWFSNKLLVSTDTVKRALSQYEGIYAIAAWMHQAKWIKLAMP